MPKKPKFIPMRAIFEQVEVIDLHGRCCDIAEEIAKKYNLYARVYVVETSGHDIVSRQLGREYQPGTGSIKVFPLDGGVGHADRLLLASLEAQLAKDNGKTPTKFAKLILDATEHLDDARFSRLIGAVLVGRFGDQTIENTT